MENLFAIKGTIAFTKDRRQFCIRENAYLVCRGTKVDGIYDHLPEAYKQIDVEDMGGKIIIPGTCDIHVHASQHTFQGIGQNIENGNWDTWFERYAFPDETRLRNLSFAEKAYTQFSEALLKTPTTRLCAYATTDRKSTELLMRILANYGFSGYVGKVNMDRNCGKGLLETTEETIEETTKWLEETKQGYGEIYPMITPRYFPSCTPQALEKLGELASNYHVPIQSHLSEGLDEIEWVRKLDPTLEYYAQAYERAGLLGPDPQAVMAHCVFSQGAEFAKLKEHHVMVAHCPQSNLNSSGHVAPVMDFIRAGIDVGLGTDVGGGNTLNMFRTIFEAILASKVRWAANDGETRDPEKHDILTLPAAFYLATKGGGSLWHTGSFEKGYCFDAVILDDSRFSNGIQRTSYERLERLINMSDDREIVKKYINGVCVYQKDGFQKSENHRVET